MRSGGGAVSDGLGSESRSTEVRARWALIVAGLLAWLFLGGTVLVPLMESRGALDAPLVHSLYSPLCHQKSERSLGMFGGTQAICARCSGLYVGGAVGLLVAAGIGAARRRRLRPWHLLIAVAPTTVDALLPWAGLEALSNFPRLAISIPAGLVAGLFLAIGIADLVRHTKPFDRPRQVGDGVFPEVTDV